MALERFHASPVAARVILVLGAVVHFVLCIPLYGRRGFPEVDPFWLAMIWLWVPPIVISAAFCRWTRRRAIHLALYAFATGFVVSWGTVSVVPNRKTPVDAFLELVIWWPMMMIGVMLTETLSRRIYNRVRSFLPESSSLSCENCGYCLHGLTEQRCPECGTPFGSEILAGSAVAQIFPTPRWLTLSVVGLVFVAALVFPSLYHLCAFQLLTVEGERAAEADWTNGTAIWFVKDAELKAFTPAQADQYLALMFRKDPRTGLEIKDLWPDWEHEVRQSSYRKVIERKLRESGKNPPDFGGQSISGGYSRPSSPG